MYSEFVNQLTREEINRGVWLYLAKRRWNLLVFWFVILIPCLWTLGAAAWQAVAGALAGALLGMLLLFALTRMKFSPGKKACFQLGETTLRITGSDGSIQEYPYAGIRAYTHPQILLLCLPKGRFAILSKRCADRGQIAKLCR